MIAIPQGQEVQAIEKKSNDIVSRANGLVIKNKADYDGCADFLRAIKTLRKEVDETFDESIKKAHDAHKAMVAAKKKHSDPLDNAEKIIKQKSLEWLQEEKRKEQEEQRKAEEAARKAEEKRKAELEAQAKRWEEKGDFGKAEERRQAAEEVFVPVPVVNRVEKAEGQAIVTTWSAEVTDIKALCKAVADGVLPITMVDPNMPNLNRLARTMQDKMTYPGVKFVSKQDIRARV